MNFITLVLYIVSGSMTFIASRVLKSYNAADDVAQLVYPIIAMFSLWLSSVSERYNKNKEINERVKIEANKWQEVVRKLNQVKLDMLYRVIHIYKNERAQNEEYFNTKITKTIESQLAFKTELIKLEAKTTALILKNRELILQDRRQEEQIDNILIAKGQLERKVTSFIQLLRQFHNNINMHLRTLDDKESRLWGGIEKLGDEIFRQINEFDAYMSLSLIEEKENSAPINRKGVVLETDVRFDAQSIEIDFSDMDSKKK
jgi:hypothetical protein